MMDSGEDVEVKKKERALKKERNNKKAKTGGGRINSNV